MSAWSGASRGVSRVYKASLPRYFAMHIALTSPAARRRAGVRHAGFECVIGVDVTEDVLRARRPLRLRSDNCHVDDSRSHCKSRDKSAIRPTTFEDRPLIHAFVMQRDHKPCVVPSRPGLSPPAAAGRSRRSQPRCLTANIAQNNDCRVKRTLFCSQHGLGSRRRINRSTSR